MSQTTSRSAKVLVVDDVEESRYVLSRVLEDEGFQPLVAENGAVGLELMRKQTPDVVLLDNKMPGMDGMEVLQEARRFDRETPIIILTAFGSIHAAVDAVKRGAYEYLTKPFDNNHLVLTVRRALESRRRIEKDDQRRPQRDGKCSLREAMGPSEAARRICDEVAQVARSVFTVIITGETGSGKELAARAIHLQSRRASGPFVPVDCGSIPSSLMESELFGHERGAFTGAVQTRIGKFEQGSGGTLFLDEVANLSFELQAKLLRALQERQICRVGGTKMIDLNIRVVAATNRYLSPMVASGDFRRDLYHRLNEFSIRMPPLRQRQQDIPHLTQWFLDLTNEELGKQVRGVSASAMKALKTYRWPGNVRELRNVIRRAVLLADVEITPAHLAIADFMGQADPERRSGLEGALPRASLKETVRQAVMEVEENVLSEVLKQTQGNKAEAARILHIDYKTIHTKLKRYGITTG